MELTIFIENFSVNHGHFHILLATGIDNVFGYIMDWLHIRLIEINHNNIRFGTNR